ncbi:MAG: TCP-1/cpn60 chaperonin family protein [Haloferacaceae archaeon]
MEDPVQARSGLDERRDDPLDRPEEWRLTEERARAFVRTPTEAVVSLVRSTLGPAGLDSLVETVDLQNEPETVVTTDASEILDAIDRNDGFAHPVAALLVDCMDSMQRGLGDGVATTLVLTGGLVTEGLDLVEQGVHPSSVVIGYGLATTRAGAVLDELAEPVDRTETGRLASVAATSFGGALGPSTRATYADGIARAVQALGRASDGWIDADRIAVRTAPGADAHLHRGVIVRRRASAVETTDGTLEEFTRQFRVPDPLENATVAVVDGEIDFEDTASAFNEDERQDVVLSTASEVKQYSEQLTSHAADVANSLADVGVDVLASKEPVEGAFRTALERRGVAVVDRVEYPERDVYRLGRATGANVVRSPETIGPDDLGTAPSVYERRVAEELWTFFTDCDGAVFTLVLGRDTERATAYHRRAIEDAIRATATAASDEQVLPGAGAPGLAVARAVRDEAPSIPGAEQLAFEAAADVLEQPVVAMAENAGLDPVDSVTRLRTAHAESDDPAPVGLDVETGEPLDAAARGLYEPRRLFSQALDTAYTAAELLLTVDEVLHPGVDLDAVAPRTETDRR